MDPNANLQEQERLLQRKAETGKLHNYDRYRLYDLRVALRGWLAGGGFAPNWAVCPLATTTYNEWAGAYSNSRTEAR